MHIKKHYLCKLLINDMVNLFYRTYGEKKNPVILVLHGVLGVSDNWDSFGKRFAERGYFVIVPDMRNHGQSPHTETFNYKVMAEDVKHIIDTEDIRKCVLIGHSLGGKVAMNLAFLYPEIVDKLIVLDISPRGFDDPTEHVGFIASMSRVDLKKVQSRADVEAELAKDNYDRRVVLFLLKNLSYSHEYGYRWKPNLKSINNNLHEIGRGFDPKYTFDGDMLFIRGGLSDYIMPDDFECMRHHFPNYKMITLPESGHWIHVDDPEGFENAVEKFLSANHKDDK